MFDRQWYNLFHLKAKNRDLLCLRLVFSALAADNRLSPMFSMLFDNAVDQLPNSDFSPVRPISSSAACGYQGMLANPHCLPRSAKGIYC
jgi:hypothetical protein